MKASALPRPLRIALWIVGTGYACLVALLYSMQGSLIFPGAMVRASAEEFRLPEGAELQRLRTNTGEEIALLFGAAQRADGSPDPEAGRRPTLLYFHGNGASLEYCDWEFQEFRRLGANVVISEYPGYGMSAGKPSEAGCYAAATAAYEWLRRKPGVDPRRVVAVGFSLGGAVAIDLAAQRPALGLVTFSTFSSMVDMASRQYPWVPVPLLLRHRFESLNKIRRVSCPILMVHGTADRLVPREMADRLAHATGGPVTRLDVPGAGHNDLFTVGGELVLQSLREFLNRLPS